MKYSLVIPHFGDPWRLERLLRTVPISRDDVEVIVVDDCSPDQSTLALAKARWPGVSWLFTPQNSGAGAARNVGLAHAQGEYLVFADSDDEFLPGAFDFFDEHVRAGDEVVYFLADAVQEVDGSPSNRAVRMNELCQAYFVEPTEERLERLKLGHVNPIAKVYSHFFIKKIAVKFEEIPLSNDVAFNVLAAVQATNVRVAPKKVYRIFRREGSLTVSEDVDVLLKRMETLGRLNRNLDALAISSRMHAGGFLYRALQQGPSVFLRVVREAHLNGLLWPIYQRVTVQEVVGFVRRHGISRKERNNF
ncbi:MULTISPECIES: glycosyltransferase family 2 protein [unclassified Ectothiorhodospira]|uniref:glycosyltransferase family 2 protein n=1 Tax=unclassified Ectothiorhodospira TaxID=2684909 RepID=UPI001EE832CE|nr:MULTISPECIES: glycosyltransferase family 2 protein [unclassified Ectothiorhodospira]MCG5516394.1 glycosyltransferase family 2 protein [Ectothiorhodospira sp. 9100]MCG5519356.1 glycosyltransferase family 2 protein [Ectothiorhodospira sp. 9905]